MRRNNRNRPRSSADNTETSTVDTGNNTQSGEDSQENIEGDEAEDNVDEEETTEEETTEEVDPIVIMSLETLDAIRDQATANPETASTDAAEPVVEPEAESVFMEDEPEPAEEDPEEELPREPELFELFAKQVCGYNGSNTKQAWQIFCQNFGGMIRYVNGEPDMNLLTSEQKHLLRAQIAE